MWSQIQRMFLRDYPLNSDFAETALNWPIKCVASQVHYFPIKSSPNGVIEKRSERASLKFSRESQCFSESQSRLLQLIDSSVKRPFYLFFWSFSFSSAISKLWTRYQPRRTLQSSSQFLWISFLISSRVERNRLETPKSSHRPSNRGGRVFKPPNNQIITLWMFKCFGLLPNQ